MASRLAASAASRVSTTPQTQNTRSLHELGRYSRALYKELIRYTSVHPNAIKKQKYLSQIRKDFRRYRNINDPNRIEDLLRKATSRLGYIRMEIPASLIPMKKRMSKHNEEQELNEKNRVTTLSVDIDGRVASAISTVITKARFVNWCDGNPDPDEKRQNDSLIERFHYRGPYWEKRRKGWLPQEAVDMWSGPGLTEALMNREKYDIGFDLPTESIEQHPDVKEHMPQLATRKDFGLDEPDLVEWKMKRKREPDLEDINKGMHIQYNDDQRDKTLGKPTAVEFLRGRRDTNNNNPANFRKT